ncbi:MAG: chromate resistance protein [Magnetococcales bacterium]|nr:chromate resistance protein [Magnetococcales bacterium]
MPMPGQRWTLLIHNIPPRPAYLRNKVANRLTALGAVALKNSVYLLPDSASARESFMWLAQEVEAGGGKAFVGEALFLGSGVDAGIRAVFDATRSADYRPLLEQAEALRQTLSAGGHEELEGLRAALSGLQKRAEAVARLDFFGAEAGERLRGMLTGLESLLSRLARNSADGEGRQQPGAADFRGRVWVTRAGLQVDRMACGWLIRRFIDAEARFRFVEGWEAGLKPGEVAFDMPGGAFSHEGEECSFEVMVRRLGLENPGLNRLAGIIHDLDINPGEKIHAESPGLERLLAGIARTARDDLERLRRSGMVLEELYIGLSSE